MTKSKRSVSCALLFGTLLPALISSAILLEKSEAKLSAEPKPVRDKTTEYSVRTQVQPCTAATQSLCTIDTFLVAKSIADASISWERRIYFRRYEFGQPTEKLLIPVKSLSIRGKSIHAVSAKGDSFELESKMGHMKKPKASKEYSK